MFIVIEKAEEADVHTEALEFSSESAAQQEAVSDSLIHLEMP